MYLMPKEVQYDRYSKCGRTNKIVVFGGYIFVSFNRRLFPQGWNGQCVNLAVQQQIYNALITCRDKTALNYIPPSGISLDTGDEI